MKGTLSFETHPASELRAPKKPSQFAIRMLRLEHEKKHGCDSNESDNKSCFRMVAQTVFIATMLQAQTGACLGCRDDQVTWRSAGTAQNDTCLPCIDCPDGMEPSIPCGTVAKYGTHLHCVLCREGTFSSSYNKQQCTPCSLCSVGRSVERNCSVSQNTLCGACVYGFYEDNVVFNCLPCSLCCWDDRDQFESKCKAQGLPRHRLCTPRHEGGCQPLTTTNTQTAEGNAVINRPTTKQPSSESETTSPPISRSTNQEVFVSTTKSEDKKAVSASGLSSTEGNLRPETTTPAISHTTNNLKDDNMNSLTKSALDNSEHNKTRIIMGLCFGAVVLILVAAIFRKKIKKYLKCCAKRRSRDIEFSERTDSSVLEDTKLLSPVGDQQGALLPLSQLKSIAPDDYEKVWKRLDKDLEAKGDFRDVARQFGFAQEDIWELEKELKISGCGSPSRHLLDCLETRWPHLTIFEFIKVLQKPNVDRKDVVDVLKDYIYGKIEIRVSAALHDVLSHVTSGHDLI